MKHVASYEAKTHLPQLLDSVKRGESFLITRHGHPAAKLVPVTPSAHDALSAIEQLVAFGERHRGKLKGISFRGLIEDGRRR